MVRSKKLLKSKKTIFYEHKIVFLLFYKSFLEKSLYTEHIFVVDKEN